MFLSSSLVKQLARFGGDISQFVPKMLLEQIWARLGSTEETAEAPSPSKEAQE